MKISILSNINIDPLKSFLLKLNTVEDCFLSGYNQIIKELLEPRKEILDADFFYVYVDAEQFFHEQLLNAKEVSDYLNEFEIIIQSLERFCIQHQDKNLICSLLSMPPNNIYTNIVEKQNIILEAEFLLNSKLIKLRKNHSNLIIHSFPSLIKQYGYKNLIDDKMWYLGRIRFNQKAFELIAQSIQQLVSACKGESKKVLVLDLDKTLWGGIVGEDGTNGIQLGEDGLGKIYRDFQRQIKALKQIGIILAICSKNNEQDAISTINNHPMMILKSDDFIIKKINWTDKAQNISEIAKELNVGLDSIVFIDDNPVEREFVKASLQSITVPKFPDRIENLNFWFSHNVISTYFNKISLTKEDTDKQKQYIRNTKRNEIQKELSIEDYIKTLDIKLEFNINKTDNIKRVAQLTQKTNQFNLTTKRYSESDIQQLMNKDEYFIISLNYSDKFGEEGIVGVAIIKQEKDIFNIDTLLISCRIIGRKVEFQFINKIISLVKEKSGTKIYGEYSPTEKNIQVKNFYKDSGFIFEKNNIWSKKL